MKHLLLLAGLLAFSVTVHAQAAQPSPRPWKAPHKTKDPHVLEVTQNGNEIALAYIAPTAIVAKFEKDAILNRWTPAEKEAEKAKLLPYGYLLANWARRSPESASGECFAFLIEGPDGSVLQRWMPQPSVAQLFTFMSASLYTNSEVVPLSAPIPDGAHVYVIEAGAQKRFEYLIHP